MAVTRIKPRRKLLEPGWAGQLSDSEIEFIQRELKRYPSLWRRWGYKKAMVRGVPIPASTIAVSPYTDYHRCAGSYLDL